MDSPWKVEGCTDAELAEAYFNSWQSAHAAITEKDREIEHLREELDWKEAGGVDRITGQAWLTTRMRLEAEILELKMKLEDKEIERLKQHSCPEYVTMCNCPRCGGFAPKEYEKEDSDG